MIQVAAAIIQKNDKILICQRNAGGNFAFLWEFPGGKLELNETFEQCVIRECKEELDIDIKIKDIFANMIYSYTDKDITFTFFNTEFIGGEIKMNVHKDIKWVLRSELKNYKFCPADENIVNSLK